MRALYFEHHLRYLTAAPAPIPAANEVLIRPRLSGICNTDLEIMRGYMNFTGILGHEFVGEVVQANDAPEWVGRRVVGEINAYCGQCPACRHGDPTHCPNRTTLGIAGRNGTLADLFTLPTHVLHPVPAGVSDEQAVFTEPLAAACEIIEQTHVKPTDRVIVLGDGKLGLLAAQVLRLTGCDLTVQGKHPEKLAILSKQGINTRLIDEPIEANADVVIEATGNAAGFAAARLLVRPRGKLVLKSTFHGDVSLNLSMITVDEITLIGSRCGPFAPALRLLAQKLVEVEPLIAAVYPLSDGVAAFDRAAEPGTLKVLVSTD